MRKDLFVVGATLLGVWQLVGAVGSLVYVLVNWLGVYQTSPASTQYNLIHAVYESALGLYLIFRPVQLFELIQTLSGTGEGQQKNKDDADTTASTPK